MMTNFDSLSSDSSQILSQELLGVAQASIVAETNSPEDVCLQVEFIKHKLSVRLADHVENSPWDEVIYRAPWLTAQVEALRNERARLRTELLTLPPASPETVSDEQGRNLTLQAWEKFSEDFLECESMESNLMVQAYESHRVDGV